MTEKVTTMVLHVDLQCPRCYKKAKKVLCKFPQIRDRIFDEKGNKVLITVVCCSPEKIRDKLCYKGGGVIKSIEIQEKPKEKAPEEAGKPKAAAAPEKSKEQEKPKAAAVAVAPEKPKAAGAAPEKPKAAAVAPEKPKAASQEKPKAAVPEKPKATDAPEKPKMPEKQNGKGDNIPAAEKPKAIPVTGNPPLVPGKMEAVTAQGVPQFYPGMPFYDSGYHGVPYYNGYGVPPPPQPFFEGYNHGPPINHHGYPIQQYEHYFTEENPSACSIM